MCVCVCVCVCVYVLERKREDLVRVNTRGFKRDSFPFSSLPFFTCSVHIPASTQGLALFWF